VCRLGAQLDRDPGHCPPSLLALGVTSITQLVIVLISGSVALLADTIYNFSDALTATDSAASQTSRCCDRNDHHVRRAGRLRVGARDPLRISARSEFLYSGTGR
jgi:hypothetical protein